MLMQVSEPSLIVMMEWILRYSVILLLMPSQKNTMQKNGYNIGDIGKKDFKHIKNRKRKKEWRFSSNVSMIAKQNDFSPRKHHESVEISRLLWIVSWAKTIPLFSGIVFFYALHEFEYTWDDQILDDHEVDGLDGPQKFLHDLISETDLHELEQVRNKKMR